MLHVLGVEYCGGHRLRLAFSDGLAGEVDLSGSLQGSVFAPLRDPDAFAAVRLDPELRTVTWSNGADSAPEFSHDLATPASLRVHACGANIATTLPWRSSRFIPTELWR